MRLYVCVCVCGLMYKHNGENLDIRLWNLYHVYTKGGYENVKPCFSGKQAQLVTHMIKCKSWKATYLLALHFMHDIHC